MPNVIPREESGYTILVEGDIITSDCEFWDSWVERWHPLVDFPEGRTWTLWNYSYMRRKGQASIIDGF